MHIKSFTIRRVESQIMKITSFQFCIICDFDEIKLQIGTGFVFLRKDWIVTAAHVIKNKNGSVRDKLFARFPSINNDSVPLKVILCLIQSDIAILQIEGNNNPCTQPLFPGHDDLSVSTGLISLGYTPSKGNVISIIREKIYKKNVWQWQNNENQIIFEFENSVIEGGCSGGPVFGDGGCVLGVLMEVFKNPEKPSKQYVRVTSIQNLMTAISIDINIEKSEPMIL